MYLQLFRETSFCVRKLKNGLAARKFFKGYFRKGTVLAVVSGNYCSFCVQKLKKWPCCKNLFLEICDIGCHKIKNLVLILKMDTALSEKYAIIKTLKLKKLLEAKNVAKY
jgi:hypothetical protein